MNCYYHLDWSQRYGFWVLLALMITCYRKIISQLQILTHIKVSHDASFAVYKVARELDKKIPKDIAVVGYVSERMAPYLSPELTTINQHSFTMGKTAATLLIEQLESKDVNNQTIVINSTLSKRSST